MTPVRKRCSEVAQTYAESFLESPTSDPVEAIAGLMTLVVIGMQIGYLLAARGWITEADLMGDLDAESRMAAESACAFIHADRPVRDGARHQPPIDNGPRLPMDEAPR